MTPFGVRVRELRAKKGVKLKQMAEDLGVSSAYLSALEHGHRGRPAVGMIMQICGYFNLIWDESEDLKRLAILSHPRIVVDTAGLNPKATELANLLSETIAELDEDTMDWVMDEMIWAFEKCRDHWEADYYGPYIDGEDGVFSGHFEWTDNEGLLAHQERMTNGFKLLGKYYENLWD